jgi:hypothetical protein
LPRKCHFYRHTRSLPTEPHKIMTQETVDCQCTYKRRNYIIIIFSGSAAQRGLWPPRSRSSLITHNDAPQSVGLLWTSDQIVPETSTWQHTTQQTNIHASGGIRTHGCSGRAAVYLRLRLRGQWDRHKDEITYVNVDWISYMKCLVVILVNKTFWFSKFNENLALNTYCVCFPLEE